MALPLGDTLNRSIVEASSDTKRISVAGMLAFVALLCGAFFWATWASIDGTIVVPGQLTIKHDKIQVQHQSGGRVSEILVRTGDSVTKGQPMLILDGSTYLQELNATEKKIFLTRAKLKKTNAALHQVSENGTIFADDLETIDDNWIESQATVHEQKTEAEAQIHSLQIQSIREEMREQLVRIENLESQAQSSAEFLDLLSQDLARHRKLYDSGLGVVTAANEIERSHIQASSTLRRTRAEIREASARLPSFSHRIEQLNTSRTESALEDQLNFQSALIELELRASTLRSKLSEITIYAPVNGMILSSNRASEHSIIEPAATIFEIVPANQPLEIQALVRPRNIDQFFVGQVVTFRFTTIERFMQNSFTGTVRIISAATKLTDKVGEERFEILVGLDNPLDEIDEALRPGVPVELYVSGNAFSPLSKFLSAFRNFIWHANQAG